MSGKGSLRNGLLAASAAVALTMALFAYAPSAVAADRMVLAENFTATW